MALEAFEILVVELHGCSKAMKFMKVRQWNRVLARKRFSLQSQKFEISHCWIVPSTWHQELRNSKA